MPDSEKTAVVVSGGTAKGAYAAGLLEALFKRFPELADRVQIVSGTSTGSLVAPMLALYLLSGNTQLLDIMIDRYHVPSTAVFRDEPRKLLWCLVQRLVRPFLDDTQARMVAMLGETGAALDTTPLRAIIAAEYTDARFNELRQGCDRVACLVNCVSAQTGGVVAFSSADPAMTPQVFRDAIYASCLQPIFMPLQTIKRAGDLHSEDYMDAGVRDVVPAYSAWKAGATRMLLVTLFREGDAWVDGPFTGRKNLLGLLQRVVLGLLNQEVEDDDLLQARYLATIGKLLRWALAHGGSADALAVELSALIAEEQEHFSGPHFLDRLFVHRPSPSAPLVADFRWTAEQMARSIDAGRAVVTSTDEGQRMRDFLMEA